MANLNYHHVDSALIALFRLVDTPIFAFFIGIALMSLLCILIGRATLALTMRINRSHIAAGDRKMRQMHNLSIKALAYKDKIAYKSCNKEANDAFGKMFFLQIALGISSLWPVPFALDWLQYRFMDVRFELPFTLPVFGDTVGFMFSFIPMYILVYILFGKVKAHLTAFRKSRRLGQNALEAEPEPLLSLSDLASGDFQPGKRPDAAGTAAAG